MTRAVTAPPKAGTFADVVLTWTAPAAAAGKVVGVSLAMTGSGAGRYVDLDNVRLSVAPISSIGVLGPVTRQVVQRDAKGLGSVYVGGVAPPGTVVRARLVVRAGVRGTTTSWVTMGSTPTGGPFHGWVRSVRAGWYDLVVQQLRGGVVRTSKVVPRIGVGEVFIAAGQSNSANFGSPAQTPSDDRVSARGKGLTGWQLAADPQPNAGGTMGSPWPDFGSTLAASTGIPVAVVSLGVSRTEVGQWQPGGALYPTLKAAMKTMGPNGFRAVLWHQGETDAAGCTSTDNYARLLRTIITTSRADAGFAVPWGVATASNLTINTPTCKDAVRAGQQQVVRTTPGTFAGPDTDGYRANGWTWDDTHFNDTGLLQHGQAWSAAVRAWGGVPA